MILLFDVPLQLDFLVMRCALGPGAAQMGEGAFSPPDLSAE